MKQSEALKALKLGHNVFLTGPAGSGKTYLLNQYIKYLNDQNINVGITASTGIAATHLGGITIHSWSGIGIKKTLNEEDISELLKRLYLYDRLRNTKVLIIDEISMLQAQLLDMVDRVCRIFRNNDSPFGGLQIIMCGDFFQLPPVNTDNFENNFAWKSKIWNSMNLQVCYLVEQHRQSDFEYLTLLNDIRSSAICDSSLKLLSTRYNQEIKGFDKPTKLYTHNADVDAINNMELDKINAKPHTHIMTCLGNDKLVQTLKKSCLAPETLILKTGALVMFIKNNFEKGYVNGTLGKIVGYDKNDYPKVKTANGNIIIAAPADWSIDEKDAPLASISQIPLRLAWAITVHKSQGMSLDAAEIDLSKSFVPGMGYVALSRIRTLAGLKLTGINDMAYLVNEEVLQIDKFFREQSKNYESELNL